MWKEKRSSSTGRGTNGRRLESPLERSGKSIEVKHWQLKRKPIPPSPHDSPIRIITVSPGNNIHQPAVDIISHNPFIINQKQHENQDKRQQNSVDHLRIIHDGNQRHIGQKNNSRSQKNHQRVKTVKLRRFHKFRIQTGFPAKGFTNRISGGKRQNRGGKQATR